MIEFVRFVRTASGVVGGIYVDLILFGGCGVRVSNIPHEVNSNRPYIIPKNRHNFFNSLKNIILEFVLFLINEIYKKIA